MHAVDSDVDKVSDEIRCPMTSLFTEPGVPEDRLLSDTSAYRALSGLLLDIVHHRDLSLVPMWDIDPFIDSS